MPEVTRNCLNDKMHCGVVLDVFKDNLNFDCDVKYRLLGNQLLKQDFQYAVDLHSIRKKKEKSLMCPNRQI
jgi:hypothetical protein